MFDINLYFGFYKRVNSTLRPPSGGSADVEELTVTGNLKSSTSVLNPVIEITNFENSIIERIYRYTYCYIEQFTRYYFVKDWEFANGVWNLYLELDVLATFRIQLALERDDNNNSIQRLCVRTNNPSYVDFKIVDTMFPTTGRTLTETIDATFTSPFTRNLNDGTFILSTVHGGSYDPNEGAFTPTIGSNDYYILNRGKMQAVLDYILPDSVDDWVNDILSGDALNKALYKPQQYLNSIKYFPIKYSEIVGTITPNNYVRFGNFKSRTQGIRLSPNLSTWYQIIEEIPLPTNWSIFSANEKTKEFATLSLRWYPWGIFDLDVNKLFNCYKLQLVGLIDFISGSGQLTVAGIENNSSTPIFLGNKIATVGMDISIDGQQSNLNNLMSSVLGVAGSYLATGSIDSGIISGAIGVGSNLLSNGIVSKYTFSQGTPSVANTQLLPQLYYSHKEFTTPDYDHFGAPSCKKIPMSELFQAQFNGYYYKFADGDFRGRGFKEEIDKMNEFLTEGFYYE